MILKNPLKTRNRGDCLQLMQNSHTKLIILDRKGKWYCSKAIKKTRMSTLTILIGRPDQPHKAGKSEKRESRVCRKGRTKHPFSHDIILEENPWVNKCVYKVTAFKISLQRSIINLHISNKNGTNKG